MARGDGEPDTLGQVGQRLAAVYLELRKDLAIKKVHTRDPSPKAACIARVGKHLLAKGS